MKIIISIEGADKGLSNVLTAEVKGDYHELHAKHWNDRVRMMLDEMQDLNEGKV